MSREDSPYIYGDFWLDKRRDGKAADTWQITWYEPGTRQVRYRSTRQSDLALAKAVIHAHEETIRAKGPQDPQDAKVIPLLFNYWEERGRHADSASQIASSLRQFIGFLMQDEATADVTVMGLNSLLFERFRIWRMAPHSYDVPWAGKDYRHSSSGVSGEAVQRNLDDIRAALNHNTKGRLPFVPKVPSLAKAYRSEPRDLVLTTEQMGAILAYSAFNMETLRWVALMLGTAMRPEAALAFDPARQYFPDHGTLDLHPPAWPRTKKHNPVVPMLPELRPILEDWKARPHIPVASRKTFWRQMRSQLGLPAKTVPKTIRHTIATRLLALKVSFEDVETLLGHRSMKKVTRGYAKYDASHLARIMPALSTIWAETWEEAYRWLAVHSLSTAKRGRKLTLLKNPSILREIVVGADRLELPTLSV